MKIVKRTLGVCLIVVLSSSLSILTTAFVVNTYIQSVLASFDIKLDSPAPGIGGFMKSLTGMDSKQAATKTAEDIKESSGSKKAGASGSGNTPSGQTEESVKEKAPEDALAVMGEVSEGEQVEEGGNALDQQLVMTPEAMGDLKDSLPTDEKANIFNILMTKLPQEEMQKISTAMEDGLTESEVKELQQVIAQYVDPGEYDALMKMLTPGTPESADN